MSMVKIKSWHVIAAILGLLLIICIIGGALAGTGEDTPVPVEPKKPAGAVAVPSPSPSRSPVTVKGSGNTVAETGSVLNGPFTVEYSFGSWCGIVSFVKADGSPGARFMEDINDCAASTDEKLSGSTVVHLTNVTAIEVSNTRGKWSLTFNPMG